MADDVVNEAFEKMYAAWLDLERRDDGGYKRFDTRLQWTTFLNGWKACVKHETGGTI